MKGHILILKKTRYILYTKTTRLQWKLIWLQITAPLNCTKSLTKKKKGLQEKKRTKGWKSDKNQNITVAY